MDLQDFFPSITKRRVMKIFLNIGYPRNVSYFLSQICCSNDHLPQGAATSPALSNLVARRLDRRLMGLAQSYELVYTRYADDLTFSGACIPIGFAAIVEKISAEEGFTINREKTHLCRSQNKRIVTGISVTGKTLELPRAYRRKLRQEIHYILKFGIHSHVSKRKIKNPYYLASIYGKLQFWRMVNKKNAFAVDSIRRISRIRKQNDAV
jgi:hypothetical protein